MTINDGPLYSPSSIVLPLFPPIFLFHRRELDRGGVEGGHFEIHAAIGTDDDFTNFGASLQLDLGFAFRAGYSRHCLYSFDFFDLFFDGLDTGATNRISFFDGFQRVEDLKHVPFEWAEGLIRFERHFFQKSLIFSCRADSFSRDCMSLTKWNTFINKIICQIG